MSTAPTWFRVIETVQTVPPVQVAIKRVNTFMAIPNDHYSRRMHFFYSILKDEFLFSCFQTLKKLIENDHSQRFVTVVDSLQFNYVWHCELSNPYLIYNAFDYISGDEVYP